MSVPVESNLVMNHRHHSQWQPSRRSLLSASVTALAACATSKPISKAGVQPQAAAKRTVPIGLQLWSVREACAIDVDATLKEVAASGFAGVEFAGHYKYEDDAKGLRKTLDALGLRAEGSHLSVRAFGPERLAKTVDFYKTLGAKFLIVGGDKRFTDPEGSKAYAEEMNAAAEKLKSSNLFCGHHNHTEEFAKVGDTTYWHLFADRTSPDVFLQLDVGWAWAAGLDPIALINRYPGRFKTLHLKVPPGLDVEDPFIGNTRFDWTGVINASVQVGGAEWLMVEQEDYPAGMSPMQSSQASLRGLQNIMEG